MFFSLLYYGAGGISAIKCYVCTSATDSGCTAGDFNSEKITESQDVCTFCQVMNFIVVQKPCITT